MKIKKPELLSPAGSLESVYAAVSNGCNAIYMGGEKFSARHYAENFSSNELQKAMEYCHLHNVKVYITVNTLYKEEEITPLLNFINEIYELGVDAVIVQDFGAAMLIKRYFPDLPLHASTQMTAHHVSDIEFLKQVGFQRVVVSRELYLKEIEEIIQKTGMEIECFVHGALCVSYSGQCLMSSMIGGRSGNRGRCAQPCRLPYQLMKNNVLVKDTKQYLLSTKDMVTLEKISELIQAGVHSFKIEGRMKRPEYVGGVTQIYRKYIDQYFQEKSILKVDSTDIKILQQLFNRGGFSQGYLGEEKMGGIHMMSMERPQNWGLYLGRVIAYNPKNKKCMIQTVENLQPGDGIEIWTKQCPHPGTMITSTSKAGDTISISIKGNISQGLYVYKTKDQSLLHQIQETYQKEKKVSFNASVTVIIGSPIQLTVWTDTGYKVKVQGKIVEKAQNQPLTQETLIKQIEKSGNTPFYMNSIKTNIEENAYINIREINEVRRSALTKLEQQIIKSFYRPKKDISRIFNQQRIRKEGSKNNQFTILIQKPEQLEATLQKGISRVYLEVEGFSLQQIKKACMACHKNEIECFIALPMIERLYTEKVFDFSIKQLEQIDIDGYLLRTYGQIEKTKDSKKQRILDYTFNIFNGCTTYAWQKQGIEQMTLSPELTVHEIQEFGEMNQEIIIYGYLPVMITEQCPVGNTLGKKEHYKYCSYQTDQSHYSLLDRKGENFYIQRNCKACLVKIYNSKPIFLLDQINKILKLPVSYFRIQFVSETSEEIQKIIQGYVDKTKSNEDTIEKIKQYGYTKGHYFRGVE